MEDLTPPLRLILSLRYSIERGDSFKVAIKNYISEEKKSDWLHLICHWLHLKEQGQQTEQLLKPIKSPYRRELFFLMDRAWKGEPIHQLLCQLEDEVLQSCTEEISEFVSVLPVRSLIPLLLFQFPAFLLLLMAPLLSALLHS